ncbi:MAG: GAF domain-containing protein [Anaerolineae bacterium]|nr:GAF domain-containing protein [Anaerolineae bacterium]
MSTETHVNEAESRLLAALASLNQISATINRMGSSSEASFEQTLHLIVESATKVVPRASAVIYVYDQERAAFDSESRVSAGERTIRITGDTPRPDGTGVRALAQRRRVLSYEESDLDVHPVIRENAGAKVSACFPLVVADQIVGALYVFLHEERRFSRLELLMLDNFVNQAAMAIHQTRQIASVQRDLARTEDELSYLRHAGLLIFSRLRLEETLEAILQMAMDVTHAEFGIFRLLDKDGRNLITRVVAGATMSHPQTEALPVDGKSIMGWVAQHRQPVCISDLRDEPWCNLYYPLEEGMEMRSELAIPLIDASGRLEGVLNLESPMPGAFSEQDSHLLQALATQAMIAIQEVRLLDALQEVAQRLLTQPCQPVLDHLAALARDLLNAAASAIWTLEGDQLVLRTSMGDYLSGERIPLHDSLAGRAILQRGAITSQDVRVDERFNRSDLARERGWVRALVVPMLTSDNLKPVGAFGVFSTATEEGRFTESEWDTKVLTCLAYYAALAVHNASRQEALRAAQEQHAVAETFAVVGDIAANLLHRLNNKIGAIPVRVEGIQDKCSAALAADPYLSDNLEEIERSADEAMETVRESLSHLHPIDLSLVNVVDCVRAAVMAARLPNGVKVHLGGTLDALPEVVAGQRSLTMVFANLLDNASDAMQGKGTITVEGAVRDDWVEIAVCDDGPGIAPELHDRIFELNFSGRASPQPGKLGFGLWWVKTWMTRLGGSVAVESDGQCGTTFRISLPRAKEAL